jgi:hypothetical protein
MRTYLVQDKFLIVICYARIFFQYDMIIIYYDMNISISYP